MAHTLPALPYPTDALEPHIDKTTMEIHHDRHHKAYVDNVNKALAGNAAFESKSIDDLCKSIGTVPDANHFTAIAPLADPASPTVRRLKELARG